MTLIISISCGGRIDDCVTTLENIETGWLVSDWKIKVEQNCSGIEDKLTFPFSIEHCSGWEFSGGVTIPMGEVETALGITWEDKMCYTQTVTTKDTVPPCESIRVNVRAKREVRCYYLHRHCERRNPGSPSCNSRDEYPVVVKYIRDFPEIQIQKMPCFTDCDPCCTPTPTPTPTPCTDKNGNPIPCPPTPTPTPCYDKEGNPISCPTPTPTPTPTPCPCQWLPELPGPPTPVAPCGEPPPPP